MSKLPYAVAPGHTLRKHRRGAQLPREADPVAELVPEAPIRSNQHPMSMDGGINHINHPSITHQSHAWYPYMLGTPLAVTHGHGHSACQQAGHMARRVRGGVAKTQTREMREKSVRNGI